MNAAQAQRWIITAGIVLALAGVVRALTDDEPGLPPVAQPIAIFIVIALLMLIAQATPELAGAFAVLIIISTALTSGRPIWDAVTTLTTPRGETP